MENGLITVTQDKLMIVVLMERIDLTATLLQGKRVEILLMWEIVVNSMDVD